MVREAGKRVALKEKCGDPKRVVDVGGVQVYLRQFVHRQYEFRRSLWRAGDRDVMAGIRECPGPAECFDVDGRIRIGVQRVVCDFAHVGDVEESDDDEQRNDDADDFQRRVLLELWRHFRLAAISPADERIKDERIDEGRHHKGGRQKYHPNAPKVLRLQ